MAIMCGNIVEDTVYALIYMDGAWLARLDLYLLMFEAFCTPAHLNESHYQLMKDLHLSFSKAVCLLFDTQTLTSHFSCVFSITMSGLQGLAQEKHLV